MKIASMKADLEDLLKCEVDLVEEGTLRPWAVENVNRDKKLIYERAQRRLWAHVGLSLKEYTRKRVALFNNVELNSLKSEIIEL